jgi:translocation and assembly module TamA
LSKSKLLVLTALAGGVLAAPLPAYAQSTGTQDNPPVAATPPANPRDPIIPQSEFDEAVPPLDPELNRPLEPLDPIPTPAPNATPSPPFPPVPGPIEDVPLGDPELAAPLPPLETFNVQPAQSAEAVPDADEAPTIRYTLTVEGLTRSV